LYYLNESQVEKFNSPNLRVEFLNCFRLADGEAKPRGLEYFATDVLSDVVKVNKTNQSTRRRESAILRARSHRRHSSGIFFSDTASSGSESESTSPSSRRPAKKARKDDHTSASDVEEIPEPPAGEVTQTTPRVKTEDEIEAFQELSNVSHLDLVTIYVGNTNHEHKILQEHLVKSKVLSSWVKTDSKTPYVMHPDLTMINNHHFASLIRFMSKGFYHPRMVKINTGVSLNGPLKRLGLQKLSTSDEYSKELLRAGHLYELAEKFQVEGMTEHIFQRVTEAEFATYRNEALLKFAGIMFSRAGAGSTLDNDNKLEDWVLTKIGWDFQGIMKNHSTSFFKLASKTAKSNFFARVLRRKADLVEVAGGEPDQLE
jgi:hypothetical protein